MPLLLSLFLAFALVGCGGSRESSSPDGEPRALSIRDGDAVTATLSAGESAEFESRGLVYTIRFQRRISDGRCPENVNCVQLGEALVQVSVMSDGRPSEHVLRLPGLVYANSREGSHAWIETRGIRLTPLELTPYPGGADIDQDPQLTLRMEPSAGA